MKSPLLRLAQHKPFQSTLLLQELTSSIPLLHKLKAIRLHQPQVKPNISPPQALDATPELCSLSIALWGPRTVQQEGRKLLRAPKPLPSLCFPLPAYRAPECVEQHRPTLLNSTHLDHTNKSVKPFIFISPNTLQSRTAAPHLLPGQGKLIPSF